MVLSSSSSSSTKFNYLFVVAIAVATSIISHNTNCMFGNSILFVDAQTQSTNACTPCVKGAEMINKEAGVCIDFPSRTNGLYNTDIDCKDLQLEGYQIGCCPSPPTTDHCEYCEDGSRPNTNKRIPMGPYVEGYSCFDYSYKNEAYNGMFAYGDCSDTFLQRAGFYCGCPAQEQECWLCPDQQPPTNPYKHETWVTNSNCRELEYFFSILKEDECEAFPFQAGADLTSFCGCGGVNQTEIDEQDENYSCQFCENGGVVTNPDFLYSTEGWFPKTCRQAEEYARDIIKTPAACRNSDYFGEAREFCTCSDFSSASSTIFASLRTTTTTLLLLLSSSEILLLATTFII